MTDVSVVLRTKNSEARVEDSLASIFRQTYKDYEVLVVDHGSIDRTLQIVQKYPVRTIHDRPGTNPCNTGIQESTGRILAFIDDDCIAPPEWLAVIINDFDDEEVAVVGGPEVAPRSSNFWQRCFEAIRRMESRFFWRWGSVEQISTCNAAYRKDVLVDVGGFSDYLSYCEETELNWRLSKKGWKILFDRQLTVLHNRRSSLRKFFSQQFAAGRGNGRLIRMHPDFVKASNVLTVAPFLIPAVLMGLLVTRRLNVALWLTSLLLCFAIIWSSYAAHVVKELRLIPGILIAYTVYIFARCLGFLRGSVGDFPRGRMH